ncbi:MAG: hypothetical protein KBD15_03215 [Candidatus Magasanikbacteria bacterium]|jgi:hypothetical protein|nr:hypothetical protein [Candidatus Magasanikbacteria bacterium]
MTKRKTGILLIILGVCSWPVSMIAFAIVRMAMISSATGSSVVLSFLTLFISALPVIGLILIIIGIVFMLEKDAPKQMPPQQKM